MYSKKHVYFISGYVGVMRARAGIVRVGRRGTPEDRMERKKEEGDKTRGEGYPSLSLSSPRRQVVLVAMDASLHGLMNGQSGDEGHAALAATAFNTDSPIGRQPESETCGGGGGGVSVCGGGGGKREEMDGKRMKGVKVKKN